MLSYFRWVLFFVALFVTVMGGALFLGNTLLTAPGPLDADQEHRDPARRGSRRPWPRCCSDEGVIAHARLFRVALMIDPSPKPIKAGEYEIPAHISMQALVDLLQSGKVVQRRLTVPEGMTTAEVVDLVRKTEALAGEITLDLKEGDLLPETYFYSRDDTRDGLLSRMKEAMDKTLDEAWRKRAAGLPLVDPPRGADARVDDREGDGHPGRAAQGRRGVHQPAAPPDEARERSDGDLRPDRRQGPAQPRAHARRSAIDLAVQHLHGRRACRRARSAIPAAPRSWRRPIRARDRLALLRRRRPGRPRLRRQRRWSTTAMSSAGGRSSASARSSSSSCAVGGARLAVRCLRRPSQRRPRRGSEPCRSCFWRSSLLAAVAFGIAWFLRANPSTVARVAAACPGRAGRHRHWRAVDLRRCASCPACCRSCSAWRAW